MTPSLSDSSRGPGPGRLRALVFVCLVLTMTISTPVLAGGGALGAGGFVASLADEYADNETTSNESIRIDDSLEAADGTVEVVVRLEEPTVPDTVPADDADAYLADHAEESQEPLLDYADRTAGISVETEFRVTNAVLLTVDTEQVDLETFARFPTVEAVHENFELTRISATATVSSTPRQRRMRSSRATSVLLERRPATPRQAPTNCRRPSSCSSAV